MSAHKWNMSALINMSARLTATRCYPKRQTGMVREQQAEAACLRRCFGRQAKLDAAIAANLKGLGYGRRCSLR
jgi:hypothetical protein